MGHAKPVDGKHRPRAWTLAERALGIDASGDRDLFRVYTDLPEHVPMVVWQVLRIASIASYLITVVLLVAQPEIGLFVVFNVIVTLLPAVFFLAPGLWRNVCPMAACNQLPRLMGIGGHRVAPAWLRRHGYLIAMMLFFGIAGSRLAGLDRNGHATAVLLVAIMAVAIVGGLVFTGKSGWCSSICPLLPLQRAYGQTPFVTVRNSHCTDCLGCAKNCYDFKPRAAWQADLADEDPRWSGPRRLFAAALPGFIGGFFVVGDTADLSTPHQGALLGLAMLVSVGLYFALEVATPLTPALLTVSYAAVALNLFYGFTGPVLAGAFTKVTGAEASWLRWVVSVGVGALSLLWIARTRVSELQYAHSTGKRDEPVQLGMPRLRRTLPDQPTTGVRFGVNATVVPADGTTSILDLAEKSGQTIKAGCRAGVCGADPVDILDGASCLSAPGTDEINTLARLGLSGSSRMACCARITGGVVTVSLTPGRRRPTASRYDTSITSVVIIGGGVAGITAADFVRRGHPDCEIVVVGQEAHPLYNRMEISALIHADTTMQGLQLMPDAWSRDNAVTTLTGSKARRIDPRSNSVHVLSSQGLPMTLQYDRLILAMGARAATPPVRGVRLPGSFVLRQADDAIRIRAYGEEHRCRRAVVGGGGLLGLEAAIALQLGGLHVTVLVRGNRLLSKQIDARCAELVADHLRRAGIEILFDTEAAQLIGSTSVAGVTCRDGRMVECEIFLAATGIRPNAELARAAGVPINRGVLVDDRMRTRVPGIFAAGDVAEHDGQVPGLWTVATRQAHAAAVNALGGDLAVTPEVAVTNLKGIGLQVFSVGKVDAVPPDQEIVLDRAPSQSYRRLVLSEGRAVGATIAGDHPADVAAAHRAVRDRIAVGAGARAALHAGDWSVLDPDAASCRTTGQRAGFA